MESFVGEVTHISRGVAEILLKQDHQVLSMGLSLEPSHNGVWPEGPCVFGLVACLEEDQGDQEGPRGCKMKTEPVCRFFPIAEGTALLLAFILFLCSLHVLVLILAQDVPISLSRCLLTRYLGKTPGKVFFDAPSLPAPSFLFSFPLLLPSLPFLFISF